MKPSEPKKLTADLSPFGAWAFALGTSVGCDYVQGYHFSKPVPPEEFESFLIERGRNFLFKNPIRGFAVFLYIIEGRIGGLI